MTTASRPHRPRPRRQRPLRPRRRAGVRRGRLERARPASAATPAPRHAGATPGSSRDRSQRWPRRCAAAGARGVVVHGLNPIYTRWEEEALPLARAGMDVAERLGARFMLPGNVYNYGAAMPAADRRDDAAAADHAPRGGIRVAMEAELEARAAAGRLRATVITAGDFFGAGSGSWFDQVVVKSIAPASSSIPDRSTSSTPGPTCPTWRARSSPSPRADAAPFERFTLRRPFGHRRANSSPPSSAPRRRSASRRRGGWRHGGMPWPLLRVVGLVVPIWRELARHVVPVARAARARRHEARRALPS